MRLVAKIDLARTVKAAQRVGKQLKKSFYVGNDMYLCYFA
jgi:hypothetical protein